MSRFRRACAIEQEDRVVVTGGDNVTSDKIGNSNPPVYPPIATVQVYTMEGYHQEQLPSMSIPRVNHACSYYLNSENQVVSMDCNIRHESTVYFIMHCVVIMIIKNNNSNNNKNSNNDNNAGLPGYWWLQLWRASHGR